jgi:hypothetical protein
MSTRCSCCLRRLAALFDVQVRARCHQTKQGDVQLRGSVCEIHNRDIGILHVSSPYLVHGPSCDAKRLFPACGGHQWVGVFLNWNPNSHNSPNHFPN